jgi:hypothetical protein
MFNTSGDFLNYAVAFAVIWIVVLLTWFLWYAISIVRTAKRTVNDVQDKIRIVDDLLHLIREKLESTSTYLGLLVDIIREGMVWFRERDGDSSFSSKMIEESPKKKKTRKK